MLLQSKVILKPGKEKPILNKHHWIFSGAIASYQNVSDGDLATVFSHKGNALGSAYFNRKATIAGRMVAFDQQDPLETIRTNILSAAYIRSLMLNTHNTNAFRLINGEGDFLPGLIVDRYDSTLVLQISTLGMEKQRELILSTLASLEGVECIYEKSILPSRKEEGMSDFTAVHRGKLPREIQVRENGNQFIIGFEEASQKTGFFLDQRCMRQLVKDKAKGLNVLNCFGYTGAFSVYALAGGASRVDTVDISAPALAFAKKNLELNGYDTQHNRTIVGDVFEFLRQDTVDYGLVILDPPAFAKRKKDVVQACRGYKDINRVAMQKMPANSYLLTCSCSHYVDETLFQQVVFQAAVEAKRRVRIISKHRLAEDHPINIFHPEGEYLKSFLLLIT
jgi:23S rRNA (cytosine1962-C5)-methyltransferase